MAFSDCKMAAIPRGEDIDSSASELDTDEEVKWCVMKHASTLGIVLQNTAIRHVDAF